MRRWRTLGKACPSSMFNAAKVLSMEGRVVDETAASITSGLSVVLRVVLKCTCANISLKPVELLVLISKVDVRLTLLDDELVALLTVLIDMAIPLLGCVC